MTRALAEGFERRRGALECRRCGGRTRTLAEGFERRRCVWGNRMKPGRLEIRLGEGDERGENYNAAGWGLEHGRED